MSGWSSLYVKLAFDIRRAGLWRYRGENFAVSPSSTRCAVACACALRIVTWLSGVSWRTQGKLSQCIVRS